MSEQTQQPLDERVDNQDDISQEDLAARLDLLTEENRRLRQQYASAQRTRYRRVALGLLGIGVGATLAGVVLPAAQTVLFILGATGLFGALLTYYLTPERFIAADIGERVYSPLATNEARLTAELGLTDLRIYVPGEGEQPAWLYIPQHEAYELPSADALESLLVIDTAELARGISLLPAGAELFTEFKQSLTGSLATTPDEIAPQVMDGLTKGFELVERADSEVDSTDGRLSMRIENNAYGGAEQFDEPVASFIAVALARGLEQPIRVETTDQSASEYVVTCYWETEAETDVDTTGTAAERA